MLDDLTERTLDDPSTFWPLLRARPAPDEAISSDLCLKIAAVHAALVTAAAALLVAAEGGAARARFMTSLPLFALVVFSTLYALFRFAFARAWNRRAARLRGP